MRQCGAAALKGLQGLDGGIDGINKDQVLATSKHFIGEGGTTNAIDQGDVVCDEQTLIELHAQGHFAALEAGAQILMAAYNRWNGEPLHSHGYLLTEVPNSQRRAWIQRVRNQRLERIQYRESGFWRGNRNDGQRGR